MKDIANFFPLPDTELTQGEARRLVRKMWRFTTGSTHTGEIQFNTSWRAPTVTADKVIVNPFMGWRRLVENLSGPLFWIANHRRASVEECEWLAAKMAREINKCGYLDGRLQDKPKPKPKPTKTDVQRARYKNVLKLIKQWESKRKRANNALKKLNTKRKYYEKQLG